MAICGVRRSGAVLRIGIAGVLVGIGLLGCGRQKVEQPPAAEEAAPAVAPATGVVGQPAALDPRLHQPFAEATLADPPADDQRLPDRTLTGKSVGKLYLEVVRLWDEIRFSTADGKPVAYRATLDTELGPIEITLRPDLAPNHVRNFIALARAGYYDGLVFERCVHDVSDAEAGAKVELIEGGCPAGTGDLGFGSIGYWLKPEFHPDTRHEEGTVSACHGEEPDTAACKFYITLGPAPLLDGNYTVFGKVTRGVDVVRKIFTQPVRNDPEYPEGDRPEKPIVIRKATIQNF